MGWSGIHDGCPLHGHATDSMKALNGHVGCLCDLLVGLVGCPGLAGRFVYLEAENERLEAIVGVPTQLDRIRAAGWSVAAHNDYWQGGQFFTFWLFTKGRRCAKGEGPSDLRALNAAEAEMARGGGM